MSLTQQIDQRLNHLAKAGNFSAGPGDLGIDTGVGRLESQLTAVDSLASAFLSLRLKTDRLAGAATDDLKKLSEQLSARLNYLLEPISPIEVDPEGCTVQMRSNPPQKNDNGATYYELLVRRGGELHLCRYTKSANQSRSVVPAQVTREVFQRLASDFVASVS